jgi:hypothetical protein
LALEVGKGWVGLRGAVWVDIMSVEMVWSWGKPGDVEY